MPVVIPAAQPPDSTAVSSAPEKQQGALTAHPYYYWLLLAAAVVGIANLGLVAISPSFANRAGFLRKREKATPTDQKLDFSDPDEQDKKQRTYSDPTEAHPSPFSVRLATAAAHGTLSREVSSRSSSSNHNNNHNNSDNDGDGDDTIAMPDDEARRGARGSAADTHDSHRHNEMPKKRGVVDAGAASPQPASSSTSSSSSSTTLLLAVGPGAAPDRPSSASPAHVAFMHQPNPDYTTDTAPVDAAHGSFSSSSAASLGAAAPQHGDAGATPRTSLPVFSSPGASSAASSETTVTTQSSGSSASPYAFSYPPASGPDLPSSPLAAAEEDEEDDTAAEAATAATAATAAVVPPFDAAEIARGVGIRGDVISLLDDDGAVWRRHTRVYGGGVCLACLEAESRGGGRGSYGDSVPLEERLF